MIQHDIRRVRGDVLLVGSLTLIVGLWLGPGAEASSTWIRSYGGASEDSIRYVEEAGDGGFFATGMTSSFGAGLRDLWVMKLNASGAVDWQKTFGGSSNDETPPLCAQRTADNGLVVVGRTTSFGTGSRDVWVLKLDSLGAVDWQKTYGGGGDEASHAISQTSDGGFAVVGLTRSFGAGGEDAWVLKLDAAGNVQWQRSYGGSNNDSATSIQETNPVAEDLRRCRRGGWPVPDPADAGRWIRRSGPDIILRSGQQ